MFTRGRKAESDADSMALPTVSEIKAIVLKAVEAAVQVVRSEFAKLFAYISQRIRRCEERLSVLEPVYSSVDLLQLEERLVVLKNFRPGSGNELKPIVGARDNSLESIRRESREALVIANYNEQYSSRNNIRIESLSVQPYGDCRQVVVDFCRNKLQMPDFENGHIKAAHKVSGSSSDEAATTDMTSTPAPKTEPIILVRFRRREIPDLVVRQHRKLKGTGLSIVKNSTTLNVKTHSRIRNRELVASSWTWSGQIFTQLKSGKRVTVNPFQPYWNVLRLNIFSL
jgi:hypothetical protein